MAQKRLVILDTHAILHRGYHALPELANSKGEPTGALYGLISILVKIITDLRPDYIAAAIDLPGGTFRDAAYKEYKAGRAETQADLVMQIKQTPQVLEALGIPVYSAKGFEADDVVGTIVEKMKKNKSVDIIIASGDADTLQLIDDKRVRVFTMRKGLTDTVMYDEDGVKARFGFGPQQVVDLKGIAGDPSDNIKGVPGVGQGSALKLLQTYQSLENIYKAIKKDGVERVAEKSGVQKRFVELMKSGKKEAEFSQLLATIRRDAPVTFALPKQSWREGAKPKEALDMLAQFEFRSLIPRVKQILGVAPQSSPLAPSDPALRRGGQSLDSKIAASGGPQQGSFAYLPEGVSQEEFDKAALAVSVLDSTISKPEFEDIVRLGKSEEFSEAYNNLLKEIKKEEMEFIYNEVELPLMPVLRKMEQRGIKVDAKFLQKLSKEYGSELDKLSKRIYKHAGGEFNIGSPKQLGEVLFDKLGLETKKKTMGGQRSTREAELQKLTGVHPIIEDILAYRELSKLLSTYIDAIPTQLDKENRLHTSYVQIGAATGRMASQNPNLQNIPIKSDLGRRIRHAFVASPGMTLVSFDYSQIELRIAAILSGDKGLQEIFKSGRDVHAEVAARVFAVEPKDVSYEQRRRAKIINFGLLYGMGVMALQQGLGTSRKEAQAFYDQYLATFPRLAEYLDEVKGSAAKLGYTTTMFGRRRFMEGIRSPIPYVRAAAERMAINAPMQGSQADIIKIAMVQIDELLQKGGGHLLLQVHDELVFEIENKKIATLAPQIKQIMEEALPKNKAAGVPIIAEGKRGPNWGDMKEI